MKYLLLLLLPLNMIAQVKTAGKFNITGTILGLEENSVITLSNINNPGDTVARTLVKKGAFVMTGSIVEPNLYQLNLHGPQKKYLLFCGNETFSIKGDVNNLQLLEVSGSAVHQDFVEYQQIFNPLFQSHSVMNQRIAMKPDLKRSDSLMIAYQENMAKIKNEIDRFVVNKKNSPVAAFLLLVTSELEADVTVTEKRYNQLDPAQQKGFYGVMLKSDIEDQKFGAIGTLAPDFAQVDTAGKSVTLSSFRGKYVLVDFWASWCKPCRMENPNLVAAYKRFNSKNFTVLGVSLDRSREPWMEAIYEDGLAWTQLSDLKFWNNEVARKYRIDKLPLNFLIGPDGKFVGKNLRGPQLQMRLCELLGCE